MKHYYLKKKLFPESSRQQRASDVALFFMKFILSCLHWDMEDQYTGKVGVEVRDDRPRVVKPNFFWRKLKPGLSNKADTITYSIGEEKIMIPGH